MVGSTDSIAAVSDRGPYRDATIGSDQSAMSRADMDAIEMEVRSAPPAFDERIAHIDEHRLLRSLNEFGRSARGGNRGRSHYFLAAA